MELEWIDKTINFLYLVCIIAGSVMAAVLIEERNKRK